MYSVILWHESLVYIFCIVCYLDLLVKILTLVREGICFSKGHLFERENGCHSMPTDLAWIFVFLETAIFIKCKTQRGIIWVSMVYITLESKSSTRTVWKQVKTHLCFLPTFQGPLRDMTFCNQRAQPFRKPLQMRENPWQRKEAWIFHRTQVRNIQCEFVFLVLSLPFLLFLTKIMSRALIIMIKIRKGPMIGKVGKVELQHLRT